MITEVNGASLAGKTSEQATARIKGPAGTTVTLTVVTGKQAPRDVELERARVDVPVVESEMRESGGEKIAHVRLAGFTSGAHGEVRKAIDELLGKGAQGVVLDLRDNGGGLLERGRPHLQHLHPRRHDRLDEGPRAGRSACSRRPATRSTPKIPVVVLVNGESASASEIVTGALQDRDRAEVVGTRTFGKGVFQEVRQLSNGGALDITVGEYFTPDGRNLGGGGVKQGAGIQPDIQAEDDAKTENKDEALEVAVKTVAREAT